MSSSSPFWQGILVLVALIGVSGCGLSDYQKRMDEQRARIQDFDDANRLLDDPIVRSTIKVTEGNETADKPAWPLELFLRLPKGYGTTEKDFTVPPYSPPFVLLRYTGGREGSHAILIAAAMVVDPKGKDEFGFYTSTTFNSFVKPALEAYYQKNYKQKVDLQLKFKPERKEFKVVTPYPDPAGMSKLSYTFYIYTDEGNPQIKENTAFDVYVHERSGKQVCIVVHRPLQVSTALFKNSIEACLGTLDITADAAAKRAEFKKAKGS